jgi:hypothetical protein
MFEVRSLVTTTSKILMVDPDESLASVSVRQAIFWE